MESLHEALKEEAKLLPVQLEEQTRAIQEAVGVLNQASSVLCRSPLIDRSIFS